jgi:hypothetical protein
MAPDVAGAHGLAWCREEIACPRPSADGTCSEPFAVLRVLYVLILLKAATAPPAAVGATVAEDRKTERAANGTVPRKLSVRYRSAERTTFRIRPSVVVGLDPMGAKTATLNVKYRSVQIMIRPDQGIVLNIALMQTVRSLPDQVRGGP